jgi:cytochrome P450
LEIVMSGEQIVRIPDVTKNPEQDYYEAIDILRERSAAALIDSGGVAVQTFLRAQDIRAILTDHEHFTSMPPNHGSRGYMDDLLIPSSLDPPEHTKFRMLLQPLFTPAVARAMGPNMRALAKDLIGRVIGRGECEFIEEFATQYAGGIFCQVVGLPASDLPYILKWEKEVWLPRDEDPDRSRQVAGLQAIKDYLERKI